MPRAMRLVRSGIFVSLLSGWVTPGAVAANEVDALATPAPEVRLATPSATGSSHAAIMDLWLATSLALLLHHYRRRRRAKS